MPALTVRVIVPQRNGAKYLRRSLPSLFHQTRLPDEVVVIDDGSTLDPEPTIQELGYPVKLIRLPENRGVSAARNMGVRTAETDFIALLDCDDWWLPTKLERQMALVEADPKLDVVFTDFVHRYPDGTLAQWQGGLRDQLLGWGAKMEPIAEQRDRFTQPLHELLIQKTSFIHPSTVLIRRAFWNQVGLFDETLPSVEDLELWIRMAHQGQLALINAILMEAEQRPDSLGHQTIKASQCMLKVYATLADRYPDLSSETRSQITRYLLKNHDSLGWEYLQQGNLPMARHHLREALRMAPNLQRRKALWKSYIPQWVRSGLKKIKGAKR